MQHLLAVACGLDSMVIGESQILGQLRQALHIAREQGTLGRTLSDLGSMALRAGKRAHSETSVGAAGASLVSVGLQAAAQQLAAGPPQAADAGLRADSAAASPHEPTPPQALAGKRVLVVGAGAMSGLAVASIARAGAAQVTVTSRTRQHAARLAASAGGQTGDISDLTDLIAAADLVVTCTGASGHVISADVIRAALRRRAQPGAQLVLLDLAMPRDVDPAVAAMPGVASPIWRRWLPMDRQACGREMPRWATSAASCPRSSRRTCRPTALPR